MFEERNIAQNDQNLDVEAELSCNIASLDVSIFWKGLLQLVPPEVSGLHEILKIQYQVQEPSLPKYSVHLSLQLDGIDVVDTLTSWHERKHNLWCRKNGRKCWKWNVRGPWHVDIVVGPLMLCISASLLTKHTSSRLCVIPLGAKFLAWGELGGLKGGNSPPKSSSAASASASSEPDARNLMRSLAEGCRG